jgi:hypothetical protein
LKREWIGVEEGVPSGAKETSFTPGGPFALLEGKGKDKGKDKSKDKGKDKSKSKGKSRSFTPLTP